MERVHGRDFRELLLLASKNYSWVIFRNKWLSSGTFSYIAQWHTCAPTGIPLAVHPPFISMHYFTSLMEASHLLSPLPSSCRCCNIRIGVLLSRFARGEDHCTINKTRITELLFTVRQLSGSTACLKRRKGCWNGYGNVSIRCLMMLICPSDEVGGFDGDLGEKRGGSQRALDSFHRGDNQQLLKVFW
jgi:hypothetical protein